MCSGKYFFRAWNCNKTYAANAMMICRRPDWHVYLNTLSRFMNKCNKKLWKFIKRILTYLKASVHIRLKYIRQDCNEFPVRFINSDWWDFDRSDRKSTTGYLFQLLENCTIRWNTKR